MLASRSFIRGVRSMSTVRDNTIRLTFVDSDGNRAIIPAVVGTSLLEAATKFKVDVSSNCRNYTPYEVKRSEKWTEAIFGEGPNCFLCHVQIPSTYNDLLPEIPEDVNKRFANLWGEEHNATSRLACLITLEKKHDGMVVFVPDAPPTELN